jgi:LCP family protein required for cell wall assembly
MPGPGNSLGSPAPSDDYNVPPFATPATTTSRITVLLTGIDKSIDRTHSLTDTMIVVSVDVESRSIAMISFPRDIAQFPLYGGGTYNGKINSLMTAAATNPAKFPDGPLPTLAKELGFLLGVPINYFAAVDLDGFQKMIGAVGGVTVNVERPIADPRYDWLDGSPPGFYLAAGRQKLDARTALAFVRSRLGAGDNDFTRAARQQQLLVALRGKLTDPANIGNLPAVLRAAGESIRTNFPADRLDEMIALAEDIGLGSVERVVLQPPTYSVHPPTNTTGGTYILRLHMDAVRELSVRLFAEDSTYWTGTLDASGSPIPASQ